MPQLCKVSIHLKAPEEKHDLITSEMVATLLLDNFSKKKTLCLISNKHTLLYDRLNIAYIEVVKTTESVNEYYGLVSFEL
jgi:hypothetical protein